MSTEQIFVVDRVEGVTAVLIDERQHQVAVPLTLLPQGVNEGQTLHVVMDDTGKPNWGAARLVDPKERKRDIERRLDELRRRDPGGDITP
jgi:hypothetical protein